MEHGHDVPFNRADIGSLEISYVLDAIRRGHISADGWYSHRCEEQLSTMFDGADVLLVNSCTSALEIALMSMNVGPGDEVVLPSFTFVTTATSVLRTGAVPVFVDIEPGRLTLNLDSVDAAITSRTRVILPVHYAGVAPDMHHLQALAQRRGVDVLEDCAQGLTARFDNRALGTFGRFAAVSFHETKNAVAGEGGALIVNCVEDHAGARVIRDKGTNRNQFNRGLVEKYTWIGQGSSFGLSDLNAAILLAQLSRIEEIQLNRRRIWERYQNAFLGLSANGLVELPEIPSKCEPPAHVYYLLAPDRDIRTDWLARLNAVGVNAVFHYIPLHSSPGGMEFGQTRGSMRVTDDVANRIFRLPLWSGMSDAQVEHVITEVIRVAEA